jgi:magnesium-transporting ATPase (P-type)
LLYCQEPNDRLDDWQAQIRIGLQDIIDISINNLCMKGSFVRGNKYIIGIVIYVGKDVKKVLGNKEITTGLLRKQLSNNIVVMLIIIGILSLILGCCRVLWLVSS